MNKLFLLGIFTFLQTFSVCTPFSVDCKYGIANRWLVVGNQYHCDTSINVDGSDKTVTAITGTHYPNATHANVTTIKINGRLMLSFVPQGFSKFFENILVIEMYATTFQFLNGNEFDEFTKLVNLWIHTSKLTTISSQLFNKAPNIIVTDFRNNSIREVGRNLFSRIKVEQLQYVRFSGNLCINRNAENQTDIRNIIADLKDLCPFGDESLPPTPPSCSIDNIETAVCGAQGDIYTLQQEVAWIKDELRRLTGTLSNKNDRIV